ncbi:cation:proton antiporter [Haloarchaeobius amylolyticus]|uniref:cation:proton antiporter n=1 Tax=Haloarchaeobius amylolyticus TaxID=1198296 RepID=UPI002270B001|nr:cation:proton antiporter [Haloarchaeobius amylolyticus]
MRGIEPLLASVVAIFAIAFVVRRLVDRRSDLSYASVLVAVGLLVSVLGVDFGLELSADLILAVLLPTIVFEGTTGLDVRELRRNAVLIVVLAVVGLPLGVALLGLLGTVAFGFSLLVALLFAAVVLPTDPAAVLSLFEQFDVGDRLSVTIEGESLLNDGVAIVVFSTLVAAFQQADGAGGAVASLATADEAAWFVFDVALVGGGGFAVGAVVGYVAHLGARRLRDRLAVMLLTVVVAYGSFLLAEWALGVSGILATVGAGLLMGAHEQTHEHMSAPESFVQQVWHVAAFLVSTVLYVLIGAAVDVAQFVQYGEFVVLAAVLVVLVRALTIYPLVTATNRVLEDPLPLRAQHIMVWGGLHTVVPVGLALSLPPGVPEREVVQTMVFGVAIVSVVAQGLLMPAVLRATGYDRPDLSRSVR